jgi:GntR family transcriptional regulator
VSRATVRKAIESLIADGLLHRIHGKGTFVSRPRLESRLHLASFSQDMRRRGLTPSTTLLGIEATGRRSTSPRRSTWAPTARPWRIDRVRRADGQPIALENGWYPRDLLPGLDRQDLGGSLYEIFRTVYGHAIDSAEQTLWGEGADAATARRLDAPSTPRSWSSAVSRGRRPAAGVRRLALPRRPLPAPHVAPRNHHRYRHH